MRHDGRARSAGSSRGRGHGWRRWRARVGLLAATTLVLTLLGTAAAPAAHADAAHVYPEWAMGWLLNYDRNSNGVGSMIMSSSLQQSAESVASQFAAAHNIWDVTTIPLPSGCTSGAANAGEAGTLDYINYLMMFNDAPSGWHHRTNILNGAYNYVGVGVSQDSSGTFYVEEVFAACPRGTTGATAPPPLPTYGSSACSHHATSQAAVYRSSNTTFYYRTSSGANTASYGIPNLDQGLTCDWYHNGWSTLGVFRPSEGNFYLNNWFNTAGSTTTVHGFGDVGVIPLGGDWLGTGTDFVGYYVPWTSTFYLNNPAGATIVAQMGVPGDVPLAGDWTNKGYDSIGVYRPSNHTFYLRNSNTSGGGDIVATMGNSGDVPVVGDWSGRGYDSIGVFRPSNGTWYLRYTNTSGGGDTSFVYAAPTDHPMAYSIGGT